MYFLWLDYLILMQYLNVNIKKKLMFEDIIMIIFQNIGDTLVYWYCIIYIVKLTAEHTC